MATGKNSISTYFRDTTLVGGGQLVSHVISYLIIIILTRHLGAEGLGQYSFALSFPVFFFILSDCGMTIYMVREASKDSALTTSYYSNIYSARLLLVSIFYLIFTCSVLIFLKESSRALLLTGGMIVALDSLKLTPYALLRINQNSKLIALATLAERIIALILIGSCFLFTESIVWIMSALAISRVCEISLTTFHGFRSVPFSFNLNLAYIRSIIAKSYPFMLVGVFTSIYIQLDTVMLSFMKGDVVTGWYNAPYKLISVLNFVSQILMLFGFPQFSRLYNENMQKFKKLFRRMLMITLVIMVPAIIAVWLRGDFFLQLIYNFSPPESFLAFKILIVAQFFIIVTAIMGQIIAATGRQHLFALICGSGALFNIIANFVLIPQYSLIGAGVATLITYFIIAAVELIVLVKINNKLT